MSSPTRRQAPAPETSETSAVPAATETPSGVSDAPRAGLWRGAYPAWLASDTASALSTSLAAFAIPLLALMITGNPAQAGVIGAVGLIVRALGTVAGGVLADRHPRVSLMIAGGLVGLVLAGGFLALTLSSALGFAALLLINALMAARNGLFGVATSAALKDVVPASVLGRAQAANQGRDAVITLAGAPLGGLLLGVGGWLVAAVMVLCQIVATFSAATLRGLRRRGEAPAGTSGGTVPGTGPDGGPAPDHGAAAGPGDVGPAGEAASPAGGASSLGEAVPNGGAASLGEAVPNGAAGTARPARTARRTPTASGPRRSARAELGEAFRWLWSRADLRGALLVCTIVNLGFNAVITTVIYSLQQAGEVPSVIGLVSTGIGAGMLLGALAAPRLVARVPAGLLMITGLVLVTLAAALMPFLTNVAAIAVTLAVGMAGTPALNAGLLGYFMVATPTHLMGRASSLLDLFAIGAMPLAPLIAGLGLAWWGRTGTLLIGAALCAVSAALAWGTRSLRRLPAEAGWVAHARRFETAVPSPVHQP